MLPLTESRRQIQIERDAAADPDSRFRRFMYCYYPMAGLVGSQVFFDTARAICALFFGEILRGLGLFAVTIFLYDVARIYWNLAEIAADKRKYYRILVEWSITGPESGLYNVGKRQIKAFFKGTIYFRAILEPLLISHLRKRYR